MRKALPFLLALGLVTGAFAARIILFTAASQNAENAGTGAPPSPASAALYPEPSYTEPSGYSLGYAGLAAFDPPTNGTTPSVSAPAFAEWTRQANSGDTIAATIESNATAFVAYSPGYTNESTIALSDDRQYAITMPSMGSPDMIMLWPTNSSGYGYPVAINKAEAWWAGPDTVTRGETISMYGRNLELNGTSYVYCVEAPSTNWVASTAANPYKADFVIPQSWTNGTYTLYAHNGYGRKYGWSDALTITVETGTVWDGPVINVTSNIYAGGADPTGVADSHAAIEAAFVAANGTPNSKLYFPNGDYRISADIKINSVTDVFIYGESEAGVTIQARSGSAPSYIWNEDTGYNNVVFSNMTMKANSNGGDQIFRIIGGDKLKIVDCTLDQYDASIAGKNLMQLYGIDHVTIENCTMTISGALSIQNDADQIFLVNNEIIGCDDANTLISINRTWGGDSKQVAIIGNTVRHYNVAGSDPVGSTSPDFCKGRFVHGNGGWRDFYAQGNLTTNLSPRSNLNDGNEGEQFMYEFAYTHQAMSPSAIDGANITFSTLPDYEAATAWNVSTPYSIGDHARYNGHTWIAATAHTGTTPGYGKSQWTTDYPENMIMVIQDGPGLGQHRRIMGFTNRVVTIESPFRVPPTTDSIIAMGRYTQHAVIFDNHMDGGGNYVDTADFRADYAALMYGGAVALCIESNRMTDIQFGVTIQSRHSGTKGYDGTTYYMTQPQFFTYVKGNDIDNVKWALSTVTARRNNDIYANPYYHPTTLGNVFRENLINDAHYGFRYGGTFSDAYNEIEHLDMQVWDHNALTAIHTNNIVHYRYSGDNSKKEEIDPSEVLNPVYVGNTANGAPWNP